MRGQFDFSSNPVMMEIFDIMVQRVADLIEDATDSHVFQELQGEFVTALSEDVAPIAAKA